MLHIPIEKITEADLQALVIEGKREDVTIEFKAELPSSSDEGKREFLKDVSAMANSQGGDILYGFREDGSNDEDPGKAAELVGINCNADAVKLWMSELLNSSIEERLIGVVIREIALTSGGFVIVVRVPRSWNSPHVVRHRNHWRFYARNSAGVHQMNVSELRAAFLLTDTLAQRLEAFREERLNEVYKAHPDLLIDEDWSDSAVSTKRGERKSLFVIHLQPFDSVRPGHVVNVAAAISGEPDTLRLAADHERDSDKRLNFDGALVRNADDYIQLYRCGATEEVDSSELNQELEGNQDRVECIGATELDRVLFKGVGRRLALLKSVGISSPVLVSVSLLGVRGCKLLLRRVVYVGGTPGFYEYRLSPYAIDRHHLLLTGLVIENLKDLCLEGYREGQGGKDYESWHVAQRLLRPYCDSIWNAVGYPTSQYFDSEGKWLGQIDRERIQ